MKNHFDWELGVMMLKFQGEPVGSVVEHLTPEREVGGSKPTSLSKTLYSPQVRGSFKN